ncbi:MAG: hypothetical protein ACRDIV_19090 [Ktedonobacteraceae bacterium]
MSNSGSVPKYSDNNLLLEGPTELLELNNWVEACFQSRRRFTFTEEEVLKPLWGEGEDIRLREDSRFEVVVLPHQPGIIQWRLSVQTVANAALHDLLVDESWDGQDLRTCLERLDEAQGTPWHVFCLHDQRFLLVKDKQGLHSLSLNADKSRPELTLEQKSTIERVAPQLLTIVAQNSKKPWSTTSIMEELKSLCGESNALNACVPAVFENWLLTQETWVRVGVDTWLPRSEIPILEKRHRYAVLPVSQAENSRNLSIPEMVDEHILTQDTIQAVEELIGPKDEEINFPNTSVHWRLILRTVHLNEGIVPVPKQARTLYPHARKLSNNIALAGIWFMDASEMTVWLDRVNHQLYGNDLQEQLAFLEAGTVLEVTLTTTSIVFGTRGVDQQVAEEEARLVDLTDLAQRRSAVLESYRGSLRTILAQYNYPLRFQELYEELCSRQQHQPNSASIRSILSSSPEFIFLKVEGKWGLDTAISPEMSLKSLRRAEMVARYAEGDTSATHQEPVSLSGMIAKNRQQLTALRSVYLADVKIGLSSEPAD